MAVEDVMFMTDNADDDVAFGGHRKRDFIALFVGFVVFAFGDAINLGFM